ncbi:FAD/NAD(P)-binding protein [Microbacterium halophytorum]|uniref:FAD/NAD(P)-binding protein n=1 Tax=Microbacterium halophytorum TaxID=2067568 RepID=UPI001E3E120F|nr:FAD/NAD(P)-binding domain-containing protein [Microbacterium halophytorum]
MGDQPPVPRSSTRRGSAGAIRSAPPSLRIVVVGAGPKALYALEELAAELRRGPAAPRREVTVIDTVRVPGTGTAYDPSQPPHLRLNVSATILDEPVTGGFPGFPAWVHGTHPQLADDPHPPRAVVGEYLAQRWQRMVQDLSPHAHVTLVSARVTDVRRTGGAWHVVTDESPGPATRTADEVLIASGHAAGHEGSLARHWHSSIPLIPAALPVERMLTSARVPAGSRVAVRGGALTFLDACLSLTEGRGGVFAPDADGRFRLVHRRGDDEPAVIRPITRHGLLLDAKPAPGTPLPEAIRRAAETASSRLPPLPGADDVLGGGTRREDAHTRARARPFGPDTVQEILIDAAVAALGEDAREAVESTLRTGAEPDLPRGFGRAEGALRRSIETAEGARPPGPAFALGRLWQALYPRISASLRDCDASEAEWRRFRHTARVLERFAFGPPLVNARKLLAMIASGAVDLSWLDAGIQIDGEGPHDVSGRATRDVDVVIDAVLTPPGVRDITDRLSRALLRRGLVHVRPGRRGAMVDEAGAPVHPRPRSRAAAVADATDGLALIGRPTEDHVIGHDTLNRRLHEEGRRWAQRIAGRVSTPPPAGGRRGARPAHPVDERSLTETAEPEDVP